MYLCIPVSPTLKRREPARSPTSTIWLAASAAVAACMSLFGVLSVNSERHSPSSATLKRERRTPGAVRASAPDRPRPQQSKSCGAAGGPTDTGGGTVVGEIPVGRRLSPVGGARQVSTSRIRAAMRAGLALESLPRPRPSGVLRKQKRGRVNQ